MAASTEGTYAPASWSQDGPQVKLHHKESEQAHLALGLRAPGLLDDDRYAIGVLNAVLGGGMSSRLFVEVRERRGLCYYVRSFHDAYLDTGSLFVHAGVDTGRIDGAIEAIIEQLWRVADEGVPEDEIRKAKNYLKGHLVLGVEDPRGLTLFGVRKEAIEGGAMTPAESLNRIESVTSEDVARVARSLADANMLNLAVVGPYEDEERFLKLLQSQAVTA
jgi:predicted Zn-dependent peptidase